MAADIEQTTANIATLRAVTLGAALQAHTQASIQPTVTLSIVDIDQQSAQFACELTISNIADEDFQVGQIRQRLPVGITLNEALDTAQAERLRDYNEICRSMEQVLTSAILLKDEPIIKLQVEESRNTLRKIISIRGIVDAYLSLFLLRVPQIIKDTRDRAFKISIRNSSDIERVIKIFEIGPEFAAENKLASYNSKILAELESSEDFKQSQKDVTLKKGQQYKLVYILKGERGYVNTIPYSISFEIPFRRGNYAISRMEYVRLSVPPGSTWPTLTAMLSAAIGSYIHRFGAPGAAPTNITDIDSGMVLNGAFSTLLIPMLTALVVYNIYDMTSLKDKFQASRGWRSAVLVGFFCGFLNNKILEALVTLFK